MRYAPRKGDKSNFLTDICNAAKLNRSTFYASFLDIYDLADKLKARLENDFSKRFEIPENQNALAMFKHIYEDQAFYRTYFKLGYDENHQVNMYAAAKERENFKSSHMKYHIEFFKNGLNAIIKLWLDGGCRETPEEMAKILKDEYKERFTNA